MIVTYHEIGPEPNDYIYSSTCDRVREHLACLSSLPEPANTAITFDDGHGSHYRYAAPLLEESGFRGVFFVTAGWIGARAGFMGWHEVTELVQRGHVIQSHGWSHALLTRCDNAMLQSELARSKAFLEDRLGVPVTSISMPGGRWNARVLRACAAAGYRHVFDSNPFGGQVERDGVCLSGRLMLRRTTTAQSLRQMCDIQQRRFSVLRAQHTLKTGVRRLVGDRVYQTIWNLLGSTASRRRLNDAETEISRV